MTSRAYGARGARSPRSHYDVILIMTSRPYGARSPRSHYYVVLIVTSFATELATPTVTDVRTDTSARLIYKDGLEYLLHVAFVPGHRRGLVHGIWRLSTYYEREETSPTRRSSVETDSCEPSSSRSPYDRQFDGR